LGFVDENLPIKIKTKHSTTKEKKEKIKGSKMKGPKSWQTKNFPKRTNH